MPGVSIKDFYDLHIHSNPGPYERIGDSAEIAKSCAAAGMAGIAIKSHFESTVSKVHHARCVIKASEYPDFKVFSGISLNRGVGGVNPDAVAIALDQGAKFVWFPTLDSENHRRVFGGTGTFGASFKSMKLNFKRPYRIQEGYSILKNGRLTEEAKEIVELVGSYDAILASGHVSKEEIFVVMEYALSKNVRRLMVTHPEFPVPSLDIGTMSELAKMGIFMEFCALNIFPMWHTVTINQVKEMIEAVSPERAVLSTDSGQYYSPSPPESMRVFAQCLHEIGVSINTIEQMAINNPKQLLGIS